MNDFWKNPDLLITTGSHLYGCATPQSDLDQRGFVIEPAEYLLGRKKFDQYENKVDDIVIWGFPKFLHQLCKGTPNTFEILFAPENNIVTITDAGRKLLDNKHLFITKNQIVPFAGFAKSEWLKAQLKTKNKETGKIYFSPRVVGKKRKESHAQYGYSLKNAYHTVRLLSEAIELSLKGNITFPRPEAELLIDIRSGNMTFKQVESIVKDLEDRLFKIIDNNALPDSPNMNEVSELFYDLIEKRITLFFEEKNENTIS